MSSLLLCFIYVAISFIYINFSLNYEFTSSEIVPSFLNSYYFNYSMKPGLGSAIGLTDLTRINASFNEI